MKTKAIILIVSISLLLMNCGEKKEFKITDLHVHLKGNLSIEDAVAKSKAENIDYGIAFNCGYKFPVNKDSQIDSTIEAKYARQMIEECGLTESDFFLPVKKRRDG